MAKISVIVPVYNTEAYLRQCVDSILAQSFTDFELILVDDGSTDQSGSICDQYAALDERIRAVHQPNRGQSAARNAGIRMARGEYYSFVDADDMIHPQFLERLYSVISQDDRPAMACCCPLEKESFPETLFSQDLPVTFTAAEISEQTLEELLTKPYISWIVTGKLISACIVQRSMFTEGRLYEDNAVVLNWILRAGRILITDSELYYYRINPRGTTKSGMTTKKRLDFLWALSERLDSLRRNGMRGLYRLHYRAFLDKAAEYCREVEDNKEDARAIRSFVRPLWRRYLLSGFFRKRDRKYFRAFYPQIRKH